MHYPKVVKVEYFEPIINRRTPNGGFEKDIVCTKCGKVSSAYLGIMCEHEFIVLCKDCLNEGEKLIDKTILSVLK
jgi:hypothetical protein